AKSPRTVEPENFEESRPAMTNARPNTLVDLLRLRADESPSFVIFRFLDESGREVSSVDFAELDRVARRIAALLQASGAQGKPVLLCFEPGRSFVEAFLGC